MNTTVQDIATTNMASNGHTATTHDASTSATGENNKQTRPRHGHHKKKKDQGEKKDQDKKQNGASHPPRRQKKKKPDGKGDAITTSIGEGRDDQATKNGKDKKKSATGTSSSDDEDDEDTDDDSCFICTEPIVTYAVSACNHRTCHLCALRLRSLYHTKNCVYCNTEQKTIIFTKDPVKPFEAFTKKDIFYTDRKLDIQFEDKLTHQDTILLLQYNCPEPNCDVACHGWGELKKHTNKEHHLVLCDLCIKNKKIFAHEHTLYTPAQLNKHYKLGDKEALNKDDDSGFKGHPECHFCRQSFYGDDELYVHCRDKHEQCHICVRNGLRHQYYPDYNGLEKHFKNDHYLCQYRECLDKKFIVFDSDLDLRAHEVEVHGASGRVDLSFDYGSAKPSHASGSGRSGAGHRNKQKAQQQQDASSSTSDPTAAASAQLSSSDFPSIGGTPAERTVPGQPKKNRQNDKQNARLQKPKGFGSLSNDEQWPGLGQVSSGSQPGSPSASTTTNGNKKQNMDTPLDIQQRHAEVLQRITRLLNGNQGVQQFRALTTAYRNSSLDANGYVGEIVSLCGNDSTKAGTILKDVEDLMDNEEKKRDILRAWRNAQANLQNFPALASLDDRAVPGPGTSQRVLVIKGGSTRVGGTRTTSKSKAGVWDRVANAAAHGTMPRQSSSSSPRGSPVSSRPSSPMAFPTPHTNRTKTAWAGTTASNTSQKEDFPAMTQQFPSLPGTSRRPHPTVLTMRRNNNNASAWSPSSAATSDNDNFDSTDDNHTDTGASTDKKKKGKKGKQVLFRVGL